MRIQDLPEIEDGDYGWCIYKDFGANKSPRVVYYDDDDFWCALGCDDTMACPAWQNAATGGGDTHVEVDGHYIDAGAICYRTPVIGGAYELIPHSCLRRFPLRMPQHWESRRGGWVYVIATVPEIDLCRIKIGFATKSPGDRLRSFKTPNPTAIILGIWEASRHQENSAHQALSPYRMADSEVFNVDDIYTALDLLDRVLGNLEEE